MEIQELINRTAIELTKRIEDSQALLVFAKRRAKFEGWLKVELIDILLKSGIENVVPEAELIDVSFEDVAIELKTVNTNYRDRNRIAGSTVRPITRNVDSIIADIAKHRKRKSAHKHKYVIFIVFPLEENHRNWDVQLTKIQDALCNDCRPHFFNFGGLENSISGCLYFGKVGEMITKVK